jgi:hypothetical protein
LCKKTVELAAEELGVESKKTGGAGTPWMMRLPKANKECRGQNGTLLRPLSSLHSLESKESKEGKEGKGSKQSVRK